MSDTSFEAFVSTPATAPRATGLYRAKGKRLLDIALVLLALPVAVPVLAIAWALMRVEGGAGFYGQPRIGRDGRVFLCWKIRTMCADADARLARLIASDPAVAAEWNIAQKLRHDPRITRLGRLLRRSSIDELPQLWNILTGEMSLIGPRPFTPDQKALYDRMPNASAYYGLRPGLTGLWQVEGRGRSTFAERVRYDDRYGATLSLSGDLRIILRTFGAVLRATGC